MVKLGPVLAEILVPRGGLEQKRYPLGDELHPNPIGQHYCNIWQGGFPRMNTEEACNIISG